MSWQPQSTFSAKIAEHRSASLNPSNVSVTDTERRRRVPERPRCASSPLRGIRMPPSSSFSRCCESRTTPWPSFSPPALLKTSCADWANCHSAPLHLHSRWCAALDKCPQPYWLAVAAVHLARVPAGAGAPERRLVGGCRARRGAVRARGLARLDRPGSGGPTVRAGVSCAALRLQSRTSPGRRRRHAGMAARRPAGRVGSLIAERDADEKQHRGDTRVAGRGRARTTGTPNGEGCRGRVAAATCTGGVGFASVSELTRGSGTDRGEAGGLPPTAVASRL